MSDFIISTARALMATMQPATGTRSSGSVLVTATAGQSVVVPRNRYAIPVVGGSARPDLMVKAANNPATEDGSWTATDAGTAINFISNLGGARHNLPDTTVLLFDPPLDNVASAVVTGGAFAGGADSTAFGALRDLVMAEQLSGPQLTTDLARSPIKRFPSAIVTWQDVQPADGSTVVQQNRGAARVGTRRILAKATYRISIISSRADSAHARRHEGLYAVDQVARLVSDRQAVDGRECVSNPSGVQILQMLREFQPGADLYLKFFIYHLVVACTVTIEQIDTRSYNDWLLTLLNVDKPGVS